MSLDDVMVNGVNRYLLLLLPALLWVGCDTLKGPNQGYIVPAVEGRVVNSRSGRPVENARLQRHLEKPGKGDPLDKHGATLLLQNPTVSTDESGRFKIAPERGGYLLVEHDLVYEFYLTVWHSDYKTLVTSIDLVKMKPVKTNNVLTVNVGDLLLEPDLDSSSLAP